MTELSLTLRPFLDAAGWALVHSLWQGALVAALYACFSAVAAGTGANVRYVGGVVALALLLLLPVATACVAARSPQGLFARESGTPEGAWPDPVRERGRAPREGNEPAARALRAGAAAHASPAATLWGRAEERVAALLPWLVCAWLAGVLLVASRLVCAWLLVRRLGRSAVPVPACFEELLARVSGRLRVTRAVRLCRSALVEVPTVVGHLRPVILIPAGALLGLTPRQLEAVLAHELGNETARHTDLYKNPVEEFEQDVVRGEQLISKLSAERGRKVRYFSYPYLNTGPSAEVRARAERFLRGRGYQIHPVTVDNMDWLFSRAYIEALRREDEAAAARIRAEYAPYMERMFEFYEAYSREVVGREIPQVLMLTAGALNADCFGDLAAMMRRRGYSFVTMERAISDEAYSLPDAYTGARGDSWLARWAVSKGMEYRDTEEVNLPPYMQEYFAEFRKGQKAKAGGKK